MANTTATVIYGAVQSLTMTLASLANAGNAGRECSIITAGNYSDHALYLKIPTITTTTAGNDKVVYVYLHPSADGINFIDSATGTDAAITFTTPTNFTQVKSISCVTNNNFNAVCQIPSIASIFGAMPYAYGIVVQNNSGLTFSATESNFTKSMYPLTYTQG